MKTHRLCGFVIILSLIFVVRIHAEGTYQRTDDRKKTFVWNNDPQPGDIATWSGDRDSEGYATGAGTLSWARLNRGFSTGSNITTTKKRTPISSYSGTMVHGKFDGVVTTVDRGKTYHAKYVDGQRKGNWESGAAIAKAEKVETAPAKEKPATVEPAKSTTAAVAPATEKPVTTEPAKSTTTAVAPVTTQKEKIAEEKKPEPVVGKTTEDIPAAGPTEEKAEVSTQKSDTSSATTAESSKPATPLIAQATDANESATPRQRPVTRKAALAPGAVRAIDRPTTAATAAPKKTETTKQPAPTKTSEAKTEKPAPTAKPAPSQPTEAEAQLKEDVPAAGPSMPIEPPVLKTEQAPSTKSSAKEKATDKSLQTLTGPPASLNPKGTPLPETNPPTEIPTSANVAPSPSVGAVAKLTPVQAMDIADIEARTRGYDLGEYQLPKAEYNSASDSWSVAYVGRSADGTSKKLNVVIQDKSGKAEVKK